MTKDEVRQWLNRGWELNEIINKKLEAQYKAYNSACSCTSCTSNERVQTSHNNATEDILAKYIDLSREVERLTDELYEVRRATWQAINRVDDKLYRKILKLRYFYFKPWGYIARKVNVPSSTVRDSVLERAIGSITQYIV